jgi:hypothetical protein
MRAFPAPVEPCAAPKEEGSKDDGKPDEREEGLVVSSDQPRHVGKGAGAQADEEEAHWRLRAQANVVHACPKRTTRDAHTKTGTRSGEAPLRPAPYGAEE